jgi:hypothetical protein
MPLYFLESESVPKLGLQFLPGSDCPEIFLAPNRYIQIVFLLRLIEAQICAPASCYGSVRLESQPKGLSR